MQKTKQKQYETPNYPKWIKTAKQKELEKDDMKSICRTPTAYFERGIKQGRAETEKELLSCSRCHRETSMKFCTDCVQNEVKREQQRVLKIIYKESKNDVEVENVVADSDKEKVAYICGWKDALSQAEHQIQEKHERD